MSAENSCLRESGQPGSSEPLNREDSCRRWFALLSLGSFLLFQSSLALFGQTVSTGHPPSAANPPEYRIVKITDQPIIDGRLTDPVWDQAEVITDLYQRIPFNGQPASEPSEIRLVRDDENIYIGAYLFQDPSTIRATYLRHGVSFVHTDDTFEVAFDTFHDHRRGYDFVTNPNGARHDTQIEGIDVFNNEWEEVWQVRTSIQSDGWCAEFRIPIRILRFVPGQDDWGMSIQRRLQFRQEWVNWVPTPVQWDIAHLSYAGNLNGMSDVRPQRNLQAIPALVATRLDSEEREKTSYDLDPSLDVKYVMGANLTLDLTANTDFAQVEADDTQVNLTRFSLFFPEKREFFLESAGIFSFGSPRNVEVFFSRRIGIAEGQSVPILGGARLTGKIGPYTVGLITMQTGDVPVQDSTNYSAVRVSRDVGQNSRVGGIFTNVGQPGFGNRAFGGDAELYLTPSIQLKGFLAGNSGTGIGKSPYAYELAVSYQTDPWGLTLSQMTVGESFDPAIGFVRRSDIRDFDGQLRRRYRPNTGWSRTVDLTADMRYLTDLDGRLLTRNLSFRVQNTEPSGARWTYQYDRDFEQLTEDFEIHPDIIIPLAAYRNQMHTVSWFSERGRRLAASVLFAGGSFFEGHQRQLTTTGLVNFSRQFSMGPEYQRNWVDLPAGDFSTTVGRMRINYNYNPNIGVAGLLQWNSTTEEFSANIVFRLIYLRDSNLYIVFNERERRGDGRGWILGQRAAIFKITYRIYL
jgi:hypothetical protein